MAIVSWRDASLVCFVACALDFPAPYFSRAGRGSLRIASFAPAYLAYEPRHTKENVSLKLALLAFASAIGIALAAARSVIAWRKTVRLTADWMAQGEPIQVAGVDIAIYRIDHPFPVIAIVGVLRPRLFLASQVLRLLTPAEIKASLAHENGHLTSRDNLKRGVLRACRDSLC